MGPLWKCFDNRCGTICCLLRKRRCVSPLSCEIFMGILSGFSGSLLLQGMWLGFQDITTEKPPSIKPSVSQCFVHYPYFSLFRLFLTIRNLTEFLNMIYQNIVFSFYEDLKIMIQRQKCGRDGGKEGTKDTHTHKHTHMRDTERDQTAMMISAILSATKLQKEQQNEGQGNKLEIHLK